MPQWRANEIVAFIRSWHALPSFIRASCVFASVTVILTGIATAMAATVARKLSGIAEQIISARSTVRDLGTLRGVAIEVQKRLQCPVITEFQLGEIARRQAINDCRTARIGNPLFDAVIREFDPAARRPASIAWVDRVLAYWMSTSVCLVLLFGIELEFITSRHTLITIMVVTMCETFKGLMLIGAIRAWLLWRANVRWLTRDQVGRIAPARLNPVVDFFLLVATSQSYALVHGTWAVIWESPLLICAGALFPTVVVFIVSAATALVGRVGPKLDAIASMCDKGPVRLAFGFLPAVLFYRGHLFRYARFKKAAIRYGRVKKMIDIASYEGRAPSPEHLLNYYAASDEMWILTGDNKYQH